MKVQDVMKQLWSLPETLWGAVSRSQELSPVERRSAIVGALALVGFSLLYNRCQKVYSARTNNREFLYGDPRGRLNGYGSGMESDSDSSDCGECERVNWEHPHPITNLGLMARIEEAEKKEVEEKKQGSPDIKNIVDQVKMFRVLSPEEIKERNRRKFTSEEIDKRLGESFERAQKDNNLVPEPVLRKVSYEQFPNRVGLERPGIGHFRHLTRKVLEIDKFENGASMQGLRDDMEDEHASGCFSLPFKNTQLPISFASLFEGHMGIDCAKFFAKNIKLYAETALAGVDFDGGKKERDGIVNALTTLFIPMTEAHLKSKTEDNWAKSAAIAAFQVRNRLYVANAGDSRAIIIDRKVFALSKDHRPEENRKSVEARGVGSEVSMARAVGYPEIGTGVNPRAEVIEYVLQESAEPQFLVICCGRVWGVMSANEVGALVLKHQKKSASDIAEIIIKQAYCQKSMDNLTALVIPLNQAAQLVNQEDVKPIKPSVSGKLVRSQSF